MRVVERFDRQSVDGKSRWIARIPQEDLCQVQGVPSHAKYEAQGGPGMASCLQVLRGSVAPEADVRTLPVCPVGALAAGRNRWPWQELLHRPRAWEAGLRHLAPR